MVRYRKVLPKLFRIMASSNFIVSNLYCLQTYIDLFLLQHHYSWWTNSCTTWDARNFWFTQLKQCFWALFVVQDFFQQTMAQDYGLFLHIAENNSSWKQPPSASKEFRAAVRFLASSVLAAARCRSCRIWSLLSEVLNNAKPACNDCFLALDTAFCASKMLNCASRFRKES